MANYKQQLIDYYTLYPEQFGAIDLQRRAYLDEEAYDRISLALEQTYGTDYVIDLYKKGKLGGKYAQNLYTNALITNFYAGREEKSKDVAKLAATLSAPAAVAAVAPAAAEIASQFVLPAIDKGVAITSKYGILALNKMGIDAAARTGIGNALKLGFGIDGLYNLASDHGISSTIDKAANNNYFGTLEGWNPVNWTDHTKDRGAVGSALGDILDFTFLGEGVKGAKTAFNTVRGVRELNKGLGGFNAYTRAMNAARAENAASFLSQSLDDVRNLGSKVNNGGIKGNYLSRSARVGLGEAGGEGSYYLHMVDLGKRRFGEKYTYNPRIATFFKNHVNLFNNITGNTKEFNWAEHLIQKLAALLLALSRTLHGALFNGGHDLYGVDLTTLRSSSPEELIYIARHPREAVLTHDRRVTKKVNLDALSPENAEVVAFKLRIPHRPYYFDPETGKTVYGVESGYKSAFTEGEAKVPIFGDEPEVKYYVGKLKGSSEGATDIYDLKGTKIRRAGSLGSEAAEVPLEYLDVTRHNIEYINQRYGGNLISYGSSNLVANEGVPHVTHDYDFYITPEDFERFVRPEIESGRSKLVDSFNGKYTIVMDGDKYGSIEDINNPGRIDFNIIDPSTLGQPFESRALQIQRQFQPGTYTENAVNYLAGLTDNMKITGSPEELRALLLDNSTVSTIMDSMEAAANAVDGTASKEKHLFRLGEIISSGKNQKLVDLAIRQYARSQYGPSAVVSDLDLAYFSDAKANAELLRKINFPGNIGQIAADPEKTRNAFHVWEVTHSGFTRHAYYDPGLGAFKEGDHVRSVYSLFSEPSKVNVGPGGTAGGAIGINATRAGDSGISLGIPTTPEHYGIAGVQPRHDYTGMSPNLIYDYLERVMASDAPLTDLQKLTLNKIIGRPINANTLGELARETSGSIYNPKLFEYLRLEFPDVYAVKTTWGRFGQGQFILPFLALDETNANIMVGNARQFPYDLIVEKAAQKYVNASPLSPEYEIIKPGIFSYDSGVYEKPLMLDKNHGITVRGRRVLKTTDKWGNSYLVDVSPIENAYTSLERDAESYYRSFPLHKLKDARLAAAKIIKQRLGKLLEEVNKRKEYYSYLQSKAEMKYEGRSHWRAKKNGIVKNTKDFINGNFDSIGQAIPAFFIPGPGIRFINKNVPDISLEWKDLHSISDRLKFAGILLGFTAGPTLTTGGLAYGGYKLFNNSNNEENENN